MVDDREGTAPDAGEGGAWDPFSGHRAFAGRSMGWRCQALADSRVRIRLPEVVESRARPLIAPEAVEALMHWEGVVAHPTVRDKEDYPIELQEALETCEAQFILRNIPRHELWRDPEEALEYERKQVEYGLRAPGALEGEVPEYEPVELLDVMNADTLRQHRDFRRRLTSEVAWERCFGHEAGKAATGPQWRNVPADVGELLGSEFAAPRFK
ncbi:MAG: hypothetical protein H6744_15655 [Deltaproteobacteria bacterium]|nr:hypothetical protein [Deltaproteobacteria bacterium]MCB9788117.1 hypothetical protein [Deltaproteobacteria bacterium]